MDPITIAGAFASIVGLVRVYRAEVHEREGRDLNQYLEWLRRKGHEQLVNLILDNKEAAQALRGMLADQHGQVMKQFEELSKMLASVASQMAEFKPLADAVRIESCLSDQAVSILRQLNQAGASKFMDTSYSGGQGYALVDAKGQGSLKIDEPRFVHDDLDTLCNLNLLLLGYSKHGRQTFTITRAGAAVGG